MRGQWGRRLAFGFAVGLVFGDFEGAKFQVGAHQCLDRRFRKIYIPPSRYRVEDTEGSSGANPAVCYFFKVVQAVDDVPHGVLVWEVEEVDGTCRMSNVDHNVTYLPQAVGSSIKPEQLGDCCGGMGQEFAW